MADATPARSDEATPHRRGDLGFARRLWPFIRPSRKWLWLAIAATPIGVVGGIVQPLLVKQAIDDHIAVGELDGLTPLIGVFLAVVTVAFVARAFGLYALQHLGLHSLARLRRAVFVHITRQGAAFFDRRTTGSLMTRTTNDVEAVYESLAFGAVNLATDALTIVGILGTMLWLDWQLTLVTLALSPFIVVLVNIFRKRLRTLSLTIRKSLSRLNGFFAERIHGMRVVQLYGAEDATRDRFRTLSYEYLDAYRRSNWWDASLYAIMDGMSSLAIGLMLWFGAVRFMDPETSVTIGLLVAFIDYLGQLFIPVRDFSGRVASLQRAAAALERIFDLLDVDMRIQAGDTELARARGDVVFEDVTFHYTEDGPRILDGVGFAMAPGEVVALVGATGSGKTTIGKLLTRTYDGYTGSVRLDGHEVRDLDPDAVRSHVAVVHQDAFLFDATVAENLHLWAGATTDEDLARALKLSRAEAFVDTFPAGLDHHVTERGANLSAGQKQLLAIARAMARDTPVVILDEATASVDSETEALVDAAVAELFATKTVLVIAHRLSTIRKADRIVVLHHGKVVEQGDHDTLVAQGGRYALLVQSGFAL